ncbi:malonyl-CoA O-methyltransferase [Limimonas halophila]|uniref:Malonyl-CoA O-methyltransferase n=1 Tax=Limimonas halophila TaxID=1082479 RepID=A0A1G7M8B1_9PROT|nr:methyltransferase domain-containing protein [Limimonas halophila]SDF58048.1 malonyl-CoA O-methyltransferase [Limimonas halophila]
MTLAPDPSAVAERFSAAAETYDAAAAVQRHAADALTARLPAGRDVREMVDLGCGTGLLTAALLRRYPGARVTGLDMAEGMVARCRERWPEHSFAVADAVTAPARPADLVASSFALHWMPDGPGVLGRWAAALPPGGLVAACVPLPGSLDALAGAYRRQTGRPWPGIAYPAAATYRNAVRGAGATPIADAETALTQQCPDALAALRTLRALGATARRPDAGRPASVGALRRALAAYADADGSATLTFRVLILVAEKGA